MKKPRHNPQHPTIELVKDSYQPTKAELEEKCAWKQTWKSSPWVDRPRNRR